MSWPCYSKNPLPWPYYKQGTHTSFNVCTIKGYPYLFHRRTLIEKRHPVVVLKQEAPISRSLLLNY